LQAKIGQPTVRSLPADNPNCYRNVTSGAALYVRLYSVHALCEEHLRAELGSQLAPPSFKLLAL
jgi:hypothetical protein